MATYNPTAHTAGVLNAATVATTPLQLDAFVPGHFVTSSPAVVTTTHTAHHAQPPHHQTNATSSSYTFVQIKREPCQVSEVTTSNNCQQSATTTTTHHHQQQQHHHHHQQHHGIVSASNSISASKTMSSSSTLTTLVKIEASSPKVQDMDKTSTLASLGGVSTNNSVPIGIAVARKRPQEATNTLNNSTAIPLQQSLNKDINCFGIRVADLGGVGTSCSNIFFTGNGDLMTGATTTATAEELALSAAGVQSVNRAPSTFWQYPSNALPIESVISMSPAATVGLQYSREANRGQVVLLPATTALDPFQQAAAAFVWPATAYIPQASTAAPAATAAALQPPPNFIFPSMSPHSTLQPQPYATSLQLFGSNYLTAAAAAAAAAAASTTLCQHNQQTASQTTSSINLSLTGAGGVGGAALAGSSSTTSSCSTSSRFLSLAAPGQVTAAVPSAAISLLDTHKQQQKHSLSTTMAIPSLSTSGGGGATSTLLMPPTALKIEEWNATEVMSAGALKTTTTTLSQQNQLIAAGPHVAVSQAHVPPPLPPLLPVTPLTPLNFEMRGYGNMNTNNNSSSCDKTTTTTTTTTTTNLLELQPGAHTQALNLMRLPTPPTSATIENAAAMSATSHLLFQATPSSTPTLLNLSATALPRATVAASATNSCSTTTSGFLTANGAPQISPATTLRSVGGTLTPIGDNTSIVNYKISGPVDLQTHHTQSPAQIVVGVPRVIQAQRCTPPQMQDVNIQTDTPVCSEDENSSCPIATQQQQQQQLQQSQLHQPQQQQQQQQLQTLNGTFSNIELYASAHDDVTNQPLELTRSSVDKTTSEAEASVSAIESNECHNNVQDTHSSEQSTINTTTTASEAIAPAADNEQLVTSAGIGDGVANIGDTGQTAPEDLTGLELLSNISTSKLAKSNTIRVKQEPLDNLDFTLAGEQLSPLPKSLHPHNGNVVDMIKINGHVTPMNVVPPPPPPPQPVVEPLGGLNLLCALAEQRIQEEVQSSGGGSLFATTRSVSSENVSASVTPTPTSAVFNATPFLFQRQSPFGAEAAFPSMEGIELPSTSSCAASLSTGTGACNAVNGSGECVKRKKHKNSKSSKSSSSSNSVVAAGGKMKSQRCGKKSKKSKYAKEKRKQQKLLAHADHDWNEQQLQEELNSAFSRVDGGYQSTFGKWSNAQEIFSMMETNMRIRLANITRQYRRKKRKLDEISLKSKKKKKCSKLPSQQLLLSGSSALSLVGVSSSATSTLGEYKFANFATGAKSTVHVSPHLHPSNFPRFGEKLQPLAQFPPQDFAGLDAGTADSQDLTDGRSSSTASASATASTCIYKPIRLEPSALAAAESRNSALRMCGQKHAASEKPTHTIVCKEPKLIVSPAVSSVASSAFKRRISNDVLGECCTGTGTGNGKKSVSPTPATSSMQKQQVVGGPEKEQDRERERALRTARLNSSDGSLMLTDEHLFRKETRVLTDMGGLFYAGVLKPLQPPDVYAITLDGERGNKPHIMSREEILKDTILELAPKSVESVPVGTRLCAYWSQQYRCLYPGRAIESESSDDGTTTPDFVSVEFDDGDSGRIRLQNIRLLLSDYPIVEYNDNPLYSLGKQKKSSNAATTAATTVNKNGIGSYSPISQQQYTCSLLEDPVNTTGGNASDRLKASDNVAHSAQSAMDMYAQRSEKKRIKSLKKKTQAAAAASVLNGNGKCTSLVDDAVVNDAANNDGNRKHHKHKKRKKHKKHHHRKLNSVANDASYLNGGNCNGNATVDGTTIMNNNNFILAGNTVNAFISKREFESIVEAASVQQSEHVETENNAAAAIKLEENGMAPTNAAIKVKMERLDLEEETTSNLMSEISDENKGDDEVEHNNSKGSKIAAFLPERQLWGWLGKAYRKAGMKGRARKQFYKTIKRGKETITVGDCAVFLSTGRPDRPYIGRIESMWETTSSNKVVRVRWFYHPEETIGCPNLKYPGALFESPHEDENDVQTISHRCEVLPFVRYFSKFGADSKQYQSIYDNNDTYYLAGNYNPRLQVLKMQDYIPLLDEPANADDA